MCGILFYLCSCDLDFSEILNRGPDSINKIVLNNIFTFIGCVLHHQGTSITAQPLLCGDSLLLWNGEDYNNEKGNDGDQLLRHIVNQNELDICNLFASVNGPFATIYHNKITNKIYFGRDLLGRRSLLCGLDADGNIVALSSTIVDQCIHVCRWIELPAMGIYSANLNYDDKRMTDISLHIYDFYTRENVLNEHVKIGLSNVSISFDALHTNYTKDLKVPHDNLSVKLLTELEKSVCRRVNNVHKQCFNCLKNNGFNIDILCDHSKVAVLFSGGVDSAVVAALVDRFVSTDDSIDLLNVSFRTSENDIIESADRLTALACLKELKAINPMRRWNFVNIDVYPEELKSERNKRIAKLIQPCDSILDDSIGCALWFASRGKGRLLANNSEYVSPARVVLTGIGADELMAGYSRHRTIFEKHGYDILRDELNLELQRIASRNMGRDDRVLSSHGREGRFPFLDEDVVSFLQSLPAEHRCDLTKERGVGEKMILRHLAKEHLQLTTSSGNLKRAIQFGSKIAKVDKLAKGGKASQKCDRLEID